MVASRRPDPASFMARIPAGAECYLTVHPVDFAELCEQLSEMPEPIHAWLVGTATVTLLVEEGNVWLAMPLPHQMRLRLHPWLSERGLWLVPVGERRYVIAARPTLPEVLGTGGR